MDLTTEVLKALAHRDRIGVLELAAAAKRAGVTPKDCADAMDSLTLGTAAYHVRQLADAGLLTLTGTTPARGAVSHHYEITGYGRAGLKAAQKLARDLQAAALKVAA